MERSFSLSSIKTKLNWQGSDVQLCSLLRRARRKGLLSRLKKGKHILLQRFIKIAKLYFSFFKIENGRSHQQNNSYLIDDMKIQKNDIGFINPLIEKPQNELTKDSKDGQNNNNTKECYIDEKWRNNKASAKERDLTGVDKYIELQTQKSVCSNLSSIHKPNFRVRLYYQLNVVDRRSKLPSHLNLLPFDSKSQVGRGSEGRIHQDIKRSKPIAMNKGRMSDFDVSGYDREWPVGSVSRSDNEDVFTLDI